jgi:hypothetical protein
VPRALEVIPSRPFRVLDAPEIKDDFYLNLIDWSQRNTLAVGKERSIAHSRGTRLACFCLSGALAHSVYLWQAETSSIKLLLQNANEENYISSVRSVLRKLVTCSLVALM